MKDFFTIEDLQEKPKPKPSLPPPVSLPLPSIQQNPALAWARTLPKKGLSFLESALELLARPSYATANVAGTLLGQQEATPDVLTALKQGLTGQKRGSFVDVLHGGTEGGRPLPLEPNVVNIPGNIPGVSGPFDVRGFGTDVAGAGLTMALDPLNLLGIGPVQKAGRMLSRPLLGALTKIGENAPMIRRAVQLVDKRFGLPAGYNQATENLADFTAYETEQNLQKMRENIKLVPKGREAVTTSFEAGQQLPGKQGTLQAKLKDMGDEIYDEEKNRGLLRKYTQNYIPHIYRAMEDNPISQALANLGLKERKTLPFTKSADEEATAGMQLMARGPLSVKPSPFERTRIVPTIAEAKEIYYLPDTTHPQGYSSFRLNPGQKPPEGAITLRPVEDGVLAYAIRNQASLRNQLVSDFFFGTSQGSRRPQQTGLVGLGYATPIDPQTKMMREGYRMFKPDPVHQPELAFEVPAAISDSLNKTMKLLQEPEEVKMLLHAYDSILNAWKGWATAANPGFHARNLMGNLYQQWLADVGGFMKPELLRARGYVKAPAVGRNLTTVEVTDLAKQHGVIKSEFLFGDFVKSAEKNIEQTIRGPGLRRFSPVEIGKKIGNEIETHARFNLFLDGLEKGMNPFEAAMRVKKYLFDYQDLTQFERQVLRRVVPFYTWIRKNIGLQLSTLIEKPYKLAAVAKWKQNMENISGGVSDKERDLRPDYFADLVAMKTPMTDALEHPLYLNPNLPMQDLNVLDPTRVQKDLFSRLAPTIKAPTELYFNKNVFFGSELARNLTPAQKDLGPFAIHRNEWWVAGDPAPVALPMGIPESLPQSWRQTLGIVKGPVKRGGEEQWVAPPRVNYVLQQNPWLANIAKSLPDKVGDATTYKALSWLLGVKLMPYDEQKQMQQRAYDLKDMKKAIRSAGKHTRPDVFPERLQDETWR